MADTRKRIVGEGPPPGERSAEIRTLYWAPAYGETASDEVRAGLHRCWQSSGTVADCMSDWQAWRRRGGLIWVDVLAPVRRDMSEIAAVFDLHRVVIEIALARRARPKAATFDRFLSLRMYTPRDLPATVTLDTPLDRMQGVDIVTGERFVITIHDAPCPPVDLIWLHLQREALAPPGGATGITHQLIDEMVDRFFLVMDALVDRIDQIEEFAFVGGVPHTEQVRHLFHYKRQVMNLHRVLDPQRDALAILAREDVPFVDAGGAAFQDVFDHAVRLADQMGIYHDLLVSARESYMIRLSNGLSIASRILVVLTMLFAVPLLIVSMFGMNFEHMPALDFPAGLGLALSLILAADAALFVYFKRKLHLW